MRGAWSAKWVGAATVVALTATACGGGSDSGSGGGGGDSSKSFSYQSSEPQNPLQPANTNEVGGGRPLEQMFTGLTSFAPKDGSLSMAAAEKIETSDSKKFTVTLKDGWTFHNGEKVTSNSFVDAWNWGANTKNAQINASWFADIKGYTDVHPASGAPKAQKMSGLKVTDDKTFTIELKQPVAYFQYKLGYVAFSPLPKSFFKDPQAAGQKPVGNGPYQFVAWDHNSKIEVKTFKGYKGEDKPKNGGIVFKQYTKPEAAYADLLSGNLDTLDQVDPTNLGNFKKDLGDRAISQPMASIQNIGFPMYNKEWAGVDTAKVRQGLSMAIDRKSITKTVLQGANTPASAFVAPGVAGYKEGACGANCTFDAKKAKQLIADGGGVPNNKLTILYNSDGGHKQWVDAVCNSITKSTGVACSGDPKPDMKTARDLITGRKLPANQMFRTGWQADYPHNASFLADVYRTGAGSNDSGYSSPEFDKLANTADAAKTPEDSADEYQKAEQQLVKDMPVIPLWYYQANAGYSTNVSNVTYDWIGTPVFYQVEVTK